MSDNADRASYAAIHRVHSAGLREMTVRTVAILLGIVDAAVWLLAVVALLMSGSDPATKGLDDAAAAIVTALFLVTGAPALGLAMTGRSPKTALILALIFPAALAVLFVAAVMAFA